MGAGHGNKGAIGGQPAFMTAQRMGNQRGRHQISVDRPGPGYAGTGQSLLSNIH